MIDILIPLVIGLLLIFSPQIFVKAAGENFEKKKSTLKKIGTGLIVVAAIYAIVRFAEQAH